MKDIKDYLEQTNTVLLTKDAFEWLKERAPVLEECEDAISRQAAIDAAIDGADDWDGGYNPTREEYIKKAINALPPVTPKQKMGHWIDDTSLGYHVSICSNCDWRGHGDTCLIYKPKYCPNCGAKMKGWCK